MASSGPRPCCSYSLLIFMPGKETEGGPLLASAKLVVLGLPLMVFLIHSGRDHAERPGPFHAHCGILTSDGGGRSMFYALTASHLRSFPELSRATRASAPPGHGHYPRRCLGQLPGANTWGYIRADFIIFCSRAGPRDAGRGTGRGSERRSLLIHGPQGTSPAPAATLIPAWSQPSCTLVAALHDALAYGPGSGGPRDNVLRAGEGDWRIIGTRGCH